MKKQLSKIAILLVITMCLPLLAACDVSQFIGFQPTPPANDVKVEDKTEAKDDDVQDDELPKGMQMALGSDNNSYRVSSYKGTEANLVIPETYNGFPVTEIDENAFMGNKKLVSVVIPDSVEIIGNSAFKNCQRLETVTFGEYASMLCEIGKQAFFGCTTLEFIEFVGDEYTWDSVEKGKDWDKNAGMKTDDKKYEVVFIETSERPTEAPEVPTEKPSEDIYTDFVTEEVSQEETATSVVETAYPETAPTFTETETEPEYEQTETLPAETYPEEETEEDFYWSASELAESFNNGYSYMAQAILSEDGSFFTLINDKDRPEVYHNIYMNGNTVSGQYITIKYRISPEYTNANRFEIHTATVESGIMSPTGKERVYVQDPAVADGEWHTIIVDASTYHEYFMPSEEGTYKMAYLRVDYLNNVNVKEIDIAFISVTQSVEEAIEYGRDASTVKYYEKGKDPMEIDPATGEFIDKINPHLTVQEAIALGSAQEHNMYTADKYYVTGIVVEIYNTTYGNMYVEDEYGNRLTIYGSYNGDGTVRFDQMAIKPSVGDTITFYGIIGHYNNVPQMKNAWMTEIVRHEHVYNYNCDKDCNICGQTRMTAGSHTDANMDFRCDMCDNVMPHACLDENDSFTCDICEAAMMPSAESHLSIQKAIALANLLDSGKYTAEKFYVTGTVAKITSSSVYIQDEYGNQIYVTNVYNEDGTISLSQMATKPQVGDSVTVYGVIGRTSATVRMQNGWLLVDEEVLEPEQHFHSFTSYIWNEETKKYEGTCVCGLFFEQDMLYVSEAVMHTSINGLIASQEDGFIRYTAVEGRNPDTYAVIYADGTAVTGKYAVIKYRLVNNGVDATVRTAFAGSAASTNKLPTGNGDNVGTGYGPFVGDGEWHYAVVTIPDNNTQFLANPDGTYSWKYLRIGFNPAAFDGSCYLDIDEIAFADNAYAVENYALSRESNPEYRINFDKSNCTVNGEATLIENGMQNQNKPLVIDAAGKVLNTPDALTVGGWVCTRGGVAEYYYRVVSVDGVEIVDPEKINFTTPMNRSDIYVAVGRQLGYSEDCAIGAGIPKMAFNLYGYEGYTVNIELVAVTNYGCELLLAQINNVYVPAPIE